MDKYLGTVLAIDRDNTIIKDDAFSLNFDSSGNYLLNVYIADPITGNEENIYNLLSKTKNFTNEYQSIYLKKILSDYSLNEEEEKKIFCFGFKISKEGNVLDFNITKQKLSVDIEISESELIELIDEDAAIIDYLGEINELAELLFNISYNTKNYTEFDNNVFDFAFPRQFSTLVNETLTKLLISKDMPIIYFVGTKEQKALNMIIPGYYTSEKIMSHFGEYYSPFTSPLRLPESLFNLFVLNECVFLRKQQEDINNENIKEYLDGYVRLCDQTNLSRKDKKHENRRF